MRFFCCFERGLSAKDALRVEYALRLATLMLLIVFLGAYLYLAHELDEEQAIHMVGTLFFLAGLCCTFVVGVIGKDAMYKLKQQQNGSGQVEPDHYVSKEKIAESEQQGVIEHHPRCRILSLGLCSVLLFPFVVMSGLSMISGLQWLCAPYIYPDLGVCKCDTRPLLETDDVPDFSSQSNQGSVLIAQFGDTTMEHLAKNLKLVRDSGAELLVINGDLTYYMEMEAMEAAIAAELGDDFPVLNTVGNHDTGIYTEYQAVLQRQYNRYRSSHNDTGDLLCQGEIGVSQLCSFRGIGIALSGIGSTCSTDEILNAKLVEQLQLLEDENVTFKNVFIHKNQRILQTGTKSDEVGWEAYEAALQFGATMYNGHEHSFARTKQITGFDIAAQTVTTVDSPDLGPDFSSANLTNGTRADLEVLVVENGATHVVLQGIGGRNVRGATPDAADNPWWSRLYNADNGATYATHFCEYGAFGRDDLAYCYLQNIVNEIVDEYLVVSR